MTQVADDVLGKIARQQTDLFRRVREGSLDPRYVSASLQDIIEGRFGNLFLNTGELSIPIPALPRLTLEEIQAKFPGVKSIERDTSPTEAGVLNLATILRPTEEKVDGAEYERRIAPRPDSLYGLQHALWLVEHQDEHPAFKALLGKIYIDFSGLVVVIEGGMRVVFYLIQDGKRWSVSWFWLGDVFGRRGRLALSGKSAQISQSETGADKE